MRPAFCPHLFLQGIFTYWSRGAFEKIIKWWFPRKRKTSKVLRNLTNCTDEQGSSQIPGQEQGLEMARICREERFRNLALTFDIPKVVVTELCRERDEEAKQKRN